MLPEALGPSGPAGEFGVHEKIRFGHMLPTGWGGNGLVDQLGNMFPNACEGMGEGVEGKINEQT